MVISGDGHAVLHATCVGALHRARGRDGQDHSATITGTLASGAPYRILTVADGHGHPLHSRSGSGSRLACETAIELIRNRLETAASANGLPHESWRHWFAEVLPERLLKLWNQRCRADAAGRDGPLSLGDVFSSVAYGTTLGVVVLTPNWWLHTGIGDWDLVMVTSASASLLSEEEELAASGESTFSLCMASAASHIRSRTVLRPISDAQPPFALVLSTDGMRKSCHTLEDHLTLCRYLGRAALPSEHGTEVVDLTSCLDHITEEGSGDDISVAIAVHGALRLAPETPASLPP